MTLNHKRSSDRGTDEDEITYFPLSQRLKIIAEFRYAEDEIEDEEEK